VTAWAAAAPASHPSPAAATRPPAIVRPSPPSKFVPENRRRLQGTLLTCSLYKRSPIAALADANAAVVQFTATVGGDPKGVVRSRENLADAATSIGKTLNIKPTDRVLCTVPL